jgi:hypothetical protein
MTPPTVATDNDVGILTDESPQRGADGPLVEAARLGDKAALPSSSTLIVRQLRDCVDGSSETEKQAVMPSKRRR